MANPDTLQGSLDLLTLKILSRRARLHGYALMTGIVEISGDVLRVEEGSLYPALHRLEEEGGRIRVGHPFWSGRRSPIQPPTMRMEKP